MTTMQQIGLAMLAVPFVGLFLLVVWAEGWRVALNIFGAFGVLFGWILAGALLAQGAI